MEELALEVTDSINWKCSVKLEDAYYHRDNYPDTDIKGEEYKRFCYRDACDDLIECLEDDSTSDPRMRGKFPLDTEYNNLYYASFHERFGKKGIKRAIKLINEKLDQAQEEKL